MKEKNIKIYLLVSIALIIGLAIYGVYLLMNRNGNVILDSSKEIVFTSYDNEEYNQHIPNVNIKRIGNDINNSINDFVVKYKDVKTNTITYHYQVNGNILSLFIIVEDNSLEGASDVTFKSYNIDLNKLNVLSDEEVLDLFDLDKQVIVNEIDKKFKNYYNDEKSKNIISSNMTYQEYMNKRGLSNLKDNLYFDINKGKLNVYVDYNSFLAEEKVYYLANVGYVFEFE